MNFYQKKKKSKSVSFSCKTAIIPNMSNLLLKSKQPDSPALFVQPYPRKSLSWLEETRFLASSQGDD